MTITRRSGGRRPSLPGGQAAPAGGAAGDTRAGCARCGFRGNKDEHADPLSLSPSQIYYKVIKDIEPGEELLVHVKEGAYSLGTVPPGLDGKAPTGKSRGPAAPKAACHPFPHDGGRAPQPLPGPQAERASFLLTTSRPKPFTVPFHESCGPHPECETGPGPSGGYGTWVSRRLTSLRVEPGAGGGSLCPRYLQTTATAEMVLWLRQSPAEPCGTKKLRPPS